MSNFTSLTNLTNQTNPWIPKLNLEITILSIVRTDSILFLGLEYFRFGEEFEEEDEQEPIEPPTEKDCQGTSR